MQLHYHLGSIQYRFPSDGSILAIGSDFGVKLWDVATQTRIATLSENEMFTSVAFSLDGTLASAGYREVIDLWDVGNRELIATLKGHSGSVSSVSFSPDGTKLASSSEDGTMLLWDIATYIARQSSDPDFDGNGTVGFTDFVQFAAQFGLSQVDEGYDARYDLDENGTIGFSDFLIFASAFGKEG